MQGLTETFNLGNWVCKTYLELIRFFLPEYVFDEEQVAPMLVKSLK